MPVELAAGLIERATPALAYSVALSYAKHNSRHYIEDVQAAHRLVPSSATVERVGKAIGQEADRATSCIERDVQQTERVPEAAASISVGLHRTTVPMEEDRPSDQPPKTRRKARTKPRLRTAPDPVHVNWRRAYLGTFSSLDCQGEVLLSRHYTALASDEALAITQRILANIRAARRQNSRLPLGIVQDGTLELWHVMRAAVAAAPAGHTWHEVIDRYHVNERLTSALRLVEPDETRRARQLS